MARSIHTIGHSTQASEDFFARLAAHGIAVLADVRAYPASRRHPHFSRDALASACAERGIEYAWLPGLGGRRRAAGAATRHPAWREAGFRNYADYMDGPEFARARAELERLAERAPAAFLCAEGLWWQCHRRLIADSLCVAGWRVSHILPDGSLDEHRLPDFARVEDGRIVYDRGVTSGLDLR
jgi:uncharacterized protein (DUF488 family)